MSVVDEDDVLRKIASRAQQLSQIEQGVCVFIYDGERSEIPTREAALVQLMQTPDGKKWIVFQDANMHTGQCKAPFIESDTENAPFCHISFDSVESALYLATSFAAYESTANLLTLFTVTYNLLDSDDRYRVEGINVIESGTTEQNGAVKKEESEIYRQKQHHFSESQASEKKNIGSWWQNNAVMIGVVCAVLLLIIILITTILVQRRKLALQQQQEQSEKLKKFKKPEKAAKNREKLSNRSATVPPLVERRAIQEPAKTLK